jgi:hypothetical protein
MVAAASQPVVLAQDSLSTEAPSLAAQFSPGTNLWAVDVRLFAPDGVEVSLAVTDSQGCRLGYSPEDGVVLHEIAGWAGALEQRPITIRVYDPPDDETYTVEVALLTPGPEPVPVSVFYEAQEVSPAVLVGYPARIVLDLASGVAGSVDVQVSEGSGQAPLTNVTASLTNLVQWGGTNVITLLTNATLALPDIGAGESTGASWPLGLTAATPRGKYVSRAVLDSAQTADLTVPVVALVRQSSEVVSLLQGTNVGLGDLQLELSIPAGGSTQTWVHIPKGFFVLHASLGVAPGSTNLQNPTIDIGSDGALDWAFAGLMDVGVAISDLEQPFNEYLKTNVFGLDGALVPITLAGNAGESLLIGGLQLYLEAVENELIAPALLPGGLVQFGLLSQPGFTYRVEYTTNLTNWTTLDTLTSTNAIMPVVDSTGNGADQRFYRAVLE